MFATADIAHPHGVVVSIAIVYIYILLGIIEMWRREEELEEMFNIYSSRKKTPARSHGASRKLVIHILCVLESCLGSATITAGPVDEEKKGKKARGIIEFQISFFFPFPSCDLYFSLVLTGKMMDFDG